MRARQTRAARNTAQNIPSLENDVWRLREAFVAEPGNLIIAADFSQLEMRLLAAGSLDKKMIDVFARGWDVHMGNAAMMFGMEYDKFVEAKKLDKMVKNEEMPAELLEPWVHEYMKARKASKAIGFGQRNVRPN